MAQILQHRRGTTSELSTEVGTVGEFWMDETKNTIVVMDGTTAGGYPLAKYSDIPINVSQLNNDAGYITTASVFSGSYLDLSNVPATFAPSAHNQDWNTITNTPTTISGYGITDAFDGAFSSLTGTPTTIAGYGITDAFDGAFSSLTGTPTTVSGYGITDAFDGELNSLTNSPLTFTPEDIGGGTPSELSISAQVVDFGTGNTIDLQNNTVNFTGATITGTNFLTSYTETDPVVGAITGIVKADGAGNISAAVAGTDYLTTVAFADLTGTPTTVAGYGITDAFDGAFSSLTGTPTTLSGYGITDAFDGEFSSLTNTPTTLSGYGITDAFDGAFSSLTGTPTTLSGYGITDAATSAQGALADTAVQPGNNGGVVYQYGYSAHDAVSLVNGDFTVSGNTMIVSLTASNNAQGARVDISGHTTGGSAGVGLIYISRRVNGGSWSTWNAFSVNGADDHFSHTFVDFYDTGGTQFDVSAGDTVEYKLTNGTSNSNFVSYNAAAVDFELFWGFNFTATEVPLSYSLTQP